MICMHSYCSFMSSRHQTSASRRAPAKFVMRTFVCRKRRHSAISDDLVSPWNGGRRQLEIRPSTGRSATETTAVQDTLASLTLLASGRMLLSPATCHRRLQQILEAADLGAQTALLATPGGQLVSCAIRDTIEAVASPDEPWLDEPERIRLLLGLLSQWEDGESPRIECELGRLFVRTIRLMPTQPTSNPGSMTTVRSPNTHRFVLLINGRSDTPWNDLERASGTFSLDT